MQVLALIEEADHVCYRYRIKAFRGALSMRGVSIHPEAISSNTLQRIRQLRSASKFDAVILQRKLFPMWQLWILRRAARCLVYDLDDAVFQRDSYHKKPPESRLRLIRFWATVNAADLVLAGNDYLAERAAGYVGESRVHTIPTCVDPRQYPVSLHKRGRLSLRLAWIGQQATLESLKRVGPQLFAAAGRVPGMQLNVICDAFPNLPGVNVVPRPWRAETEAAELARCDVGISWLPDDSWSLGKCGLKVLRYMAAGLPVVANPVGMNREMVVDGQTGILATSPAEWAAAMRRLAGNPTLRRAMGAAGRRLVEERFSIDPWGPRFAKWIVGAASGTSAEPVASEVLGIPDRASRPEGEPDLHCPVASAPPTLPGVQRRAASAEARVAPAA